MWIGINSLFLIFATWKVVCEILLDLFKTMKFLYNKHCHILLKPKIVPFSILCWAKKKRYYVRDIKWRNMKYHIWHHYFWKLKYASLKRVVYIFPGKLCWRFCVTWYFEINALRTGKHFSWQSSVTDSIKKYLCLYLLCIVYLYLFYRTIEDNSKELIITKKNSHRSKKEIGLARYWNEL